MSNRSQSWDPSTSVSHCQPDRNAPPEVERPFAVVKHPYGRTRYFIPEGGHWFAVPNLKADPTKQPFSYTKQTNDQKARMAFWPEVDDIDNCDVTVITPLAAVPLQHQVASSNQPTPGIDDYFAFLRERYEILLRRHSGQPWPWTGDPVLRAWRFTNVRREDDRTTIAFRETVRDPLRDDPHVLFATIVWRWFNLIETGKVLQPFLMSRDAWNRPQVEWLLRARHDAGEQVFTGAFMVNSEQNRPKLPAILDYIDWCYEHLDPEEILRECPTKEAMFERIKAIPRQGPFSAYQVVVDLMYTRYLEDAPDLDTFTVAGPGCARGLGYVVHDRPDAFGYQSQRGQHVMLRLMRNLLGASRDPEHWPADWPPFILSDIENGCCEFAKYRSAQDGKRQKRRFPPAA